MLVAIPTAILMIRLIIKMEVELEEHLVFLRTVKLFEKLTVSVQSLQESLRELWALVLFQYISLQLVDIITEPKVVAV